MNEDRAWVAHAIHIIEADFNRSADTHLLRVPLPGTPEIALYLKDKSTHPTGSLKHRLARSLFLYGLCNGWIGPKTPILEASSGSTAVSEAYFARMLGLRFIAVVPRSTSAEKVAQIGFYGGEIHSVEMAADIYGASAHLAASLGGHYMDQFTYAERATDWRGNNNIAKSIFTQMGDEASGPRLDRGRSGNRRYIRDRGAVHPVSSPVDAVVPCRPRGLRVPSPFRRSQRFECLRFSIIDRGNRAASLRTILQSRPYRLRLRCF